MRQLTTLTSVQGSRHDISKFKQNKKLLHSLKGGYEINLQSKLVTRKLITKKKEREKDSLPSRTGRAGVSAPGKREGAQGVVSSSAHCLSTCRCPPCVPSPSPRAAVFLPLFVFVPLPSCPFPLVSSPSLSTLRAGARSGGRGVWCVAFVVVNSFN